MTGSSSWAFLAIILLPASHAALLTRVRREDRARWVAIVGAALTFILTSVLAATFYGGSADQAMTARVSLDIGTGGGTACHFALDSLNALLLPAFSLLTLAFVLGSPRSLLSVSNLRALLYLETVTLISLSTDDLLVLGVSWSLALIPLELLAVAPHLGTAKTVSLRVFRVYHGFGLVCFLGACFALGAWSDSDSLLGPRLLGIGAKGMPEYAQPIVFGAFALAALLRMGVAPFHSWLPLSIEHGASAAPAMLVAMRTSIYVLLRVAIPAFPGVAHAAMPLLTALALFSAIYGAFGALGQRDLRRMIGFFIVSQSGFMLTGLAFGDATAIAGTLLYWLGFATSTTGLVLMVSALSARTGSTDMRSIGGIVGRVPGLAACFFLFGLASIAIPGTVAFAAEDMLVHGALEQHPLLTVVMIATTVINAITFVRAFNTTFLGELATQDFLVGSLEDLLPTERVAAVSLLLVLLGVGVSPAALISTQASAADEVAARARESRNAAFHLSARSCAGTRLDQDPRSTQAAWLDAEAPCHATESSPFHDQPMGASLPAAQSGTPSASGSVSQRRSRPQEATARNSPGSFPSSVHRFGSTNHGPRSMLK